MVASWRPAAGPARRDVLPHPVSWRGASAGHETFDQGYLVVQRRSRDVHGEEEPGDHRAARGNQSVMDMRPPAADAIAPEPYHGPQRHDRTENTKPCQRIERKQQRIQRIAENGEVRTLDEKRHRRNDD